MKKKTMRLNGIDVFKTGNSTYTVPYGGENFVFKHWQDCLAWVNALRKHEEKQDFERHEVHGLQPKAGGMPNADES